jgi:hypothetical protein
LITSKVVLAGSPRDLGSKYSVISHQTENRGNREKGFFTYIPFPVDGKICQG